MASIVELCGFARHRNAWKHPLHRKHRSHCNAALTSIDREGSAVRVVSRTVVRRPAGSTTQLVSRERRSEFRNEVEQTALAWGAGASCMSLSACQSKCRKTKVVGSGFSPRPRVPGRDLQKKHLRSSCPSLRPVVPDLISTALPAMLTANLRIRTLARLAAASSSPAARRGFASSFARFKDTQGLKKLYGSATEAVADVPEGAVILSGGPLKRSPASKENS